MSIENASHAWRLGIALAMSALAQVAFREGFDGIAVALSGLCLGAVWLSVRAAGPFSPEATSPSRVNTTHETNTSYPHSESATFSMRAASVSASLLTAVLVLQAMDVAYLLQVSLWLAAIVALHASRFSLTGLRRLPALELVLFGAILATSLLLRAYDLEFYPTGLHGDEGSMGQWALRVVHGERVPPFAVGWDFHPTLFHYGQALAMHLAGQSAAGNRLFSAVLGSVAMVPLYFFLRRRFGSRVALAGMTLQMLMPWHLYFSRMALNDIGVALCAVAAMAALYESARYRQAAAVAGTWLGLSFYFGNKAVMVPAMMTAGLAAMHVTRATSLWHEWRRWCVVAVVAIAVAAPQLSYYARTGWYGPLLYHPLTRLVSHDTAPNRPSHPAQIVVHQVQASLLALQARADQSIFLSFTRVPLLPLGMATLSFLGFALCVCRWRQPLALFLLAWLFVGLLASMLTIKPPQAHRLVPMISVPIVLASLALAELGTVVSNWRWKPVLLLAVVGVVGADALNEAWRRYMAPTPWMEVTEIARAVQRLDTTHDVVLVSAPMSDGNGTLQFFAGDMRRIPKLYQPLQQPWTGIGQGTRDIAFLVSWRRYDELPKLRVWYPSGRENLYSTAPGASFLTVYEVSRASFNASSLP